MSDVSVGCSPPYSLRRNFSLNPELTFWLVCRPSLPERFPVSTFHFLTEITGRPPRLLTWRLHGCSGAELLLPHTWAVNALPTKPSSPWSLGHLFIAYWIFLFFSFLTVSHYVAVANLNFYPPTSTRH